MLVHSRRKCQNKLTGSSGPVRRIQYDRCLFQAAKLEVLYSAAELCQCGQEESPRIRMNDTKVKCFARRIAGFFFFLFVAATSIAQEVSPSLLQAMQWRLIGPHRGGRVTSVSGVPSQPAIYYIGTPGGGVWKTENGGQVWTPIFDQERVASIGAVAVAPSDPESSTSDR